MVSQAREIAIFCGLQIGRPSRFLQGLWASFSCPSVTSRLLSFVASFVVFDFLGVLFDANWFLTLIAFDKKDNAVPMQPEVIVFGRAKQITSSQSTCKRDDFFAIARFKKFLFWTERGLFGQDLR